MQLDLLSETWHKHSRCERIVGDLLDESVIFGVCETAASAAERDVTQLRQWIQSGPRRMSVSSKPDLAVKLRRLHLSLPNEGDFLLISQFEDLPPFEALGLKAEFGLEPSQCEPLFEVLGRWHVTPGFAGRLTGLLTDREVVQAAAVVKSTVSVGLPSHPQA